MLMQVEYPENLPDVLSESRQEFELEAKMAMAAKMFELKRLLSGQAAQMLGMGRVELLLSLHKMGTPAINLTEDDLLSDVENAKEFGNGFPTR
jgi:predicted HTH domain antitoxin